MQTSLNHELVPMDGWSAQRISKMITDQVDCGHNFDMPFNNTRAAAIFFAGLFNSYGVICMELVKTSPSEDSKDHQCVVLSGDVMRCPKFGSTPEGEPLGYHEKVRVIAELQRSVAASLTLREDINLYSLPVNG